MEWAAIEPCLPDKPDIASAINLIGLLKSGSILLANKSYANNDLRNAVSESRTWANMPSKFNRGDPACFAKSLYKALDLARGSSTGSNSSALSPGAATKPS